MGLWKRLRTAAAGGAPPHVFVPKGDQGDVAAEAALAHVLARPDSIRQRAQGAMAISSAVAAALFVALVSQVLGQGAEDWRWWTIAAVAAAGILWLATIWAYVHVVTLGPSKEPPSGDTVEALIVVYETYSNELRAQLRLAAWCSAVALTATAIAAGSVVIERVYTTEPLRQMVLEPRGMTAVAELCGWETVDDEPVALEVSVASDQLANDIVELEVRSRAQGTPTECEHPKRDVRLPRGAISATRDLTD